MLIKVELGFEISDENSVTPPRPVNRKHKRISKLRGAAADKWTDKEPRSSLVSYMMMRQKKLKGIYISKYRHEGLKDFERLDEIFGRSFATGNNVMYIANPNFLRQSNETTDMENEPFDCDDYVGTENVYRPMYVNTGSGTGSGKRAIACDMFVQTEGGTSTRRKKGRAIVVKDSPDYS